MFRNLGSSRGHFCVIVQIYTLKTLLRLHNSIGLDETCGRDLRPEALWGVQEFLTGGHIGVIWGHC